MVFIYFYRIIDTIDEAYEEIKGNEWFFYFWPLLINVGHMMGIATAIPFLLRVPDLTCRTEKEPTWVSCEKSDICENRYSVFSQFEDNNYSKSSELQNWVSHYDLLCATKFQISLFGSLFFVGAVIGTITVLRLGDVYGRRPVIIACNLI